jgi:guanylate kinase
MTQYIIGVLVDDLERLNDKLVKEDIPLLSRCNEHIGFLINMFDSSSINHDLEKPVKAFTTDIFNSLRISAKTAHKHITDTIKELKNPKKQRNVFIINGAGGSGKDTFIDIIARLLMMENSERLVLNVSSVDKVKQAAHLLGWDGEKNAQGRAFLHKLKTMSEQEYEGVKKYISEKVQLAPENSIVFIHIREPEEITKTINFLSKIPNTEVSTLLVRSNRSVTVKNGADDVVENYQYDRIIDNTGTIAMLEQIAISFLKDILPIV